MYVVTFYSFKGGVGRSMALVNVGYQLAQAGRTVLLVDFDLEAPGLPTFNLQRPTRLPLGIVDYVHDYLSTGEAPTVSDYLYRSETFPNGGALWVMPAGKPDEQYSSRFQEINWQDLYERRSGFLLFEELKEQWRTTIQPDYVLIDSRTGHTDIAGICTRQLPDAVCVLFFPNEQNLAGLTRIVGDIRAEKRPGSEEKNRRIALHFVVSNVPTLDDEEKIIASRLKAFSERLKYKSLAAEVHHYDSLALVNQLVFSKDRPNSYLAQEYKKLADAIRRENFADRDTALEALRRMVRGSRGGPARFSGPLMELSDARLKDIAATFEGDGEVSFWLAMAWRISGDPGTALLLFERAIDSGYGTREVYLERGALHRTKQNLAAASEDFWRVLEIPDAPAGREVMLAAKSLLEIGEKDVDRIAASWAIAHLSMDECVQLAARIDDSEIGLELIKRILTRVVDGAPLDSGHATMVGHLLGLALIGLGQFDEAKHRLNPRSVPASELEQTAAFNFAMADWGARKLTNKEMFARVVEMDSPEWRPKSSANYFQCLAIAYWAVGSLDLASSNLTEARRVTKAQFTRDFSAWRYMKVDPDEFLRDLDDVERLISGAKILPRYTARRAPESKHVAH